MNLIKQIIKRVLAVLRSFFGCIELWLHNIHYHQLRKTYRLHFILFLLSYLALLYHAPPADASDVVYRTIALEAANQPFEGQVAVACVIRTRAIQRKLTFEEVCLQPKQFSCWNVTPRKISQKEINVAKKAWEASASVYFPANHYCTTAIHPYWEDSMTHLITIDDHKFFTDRPFRNEMEKDLRASLQFASGS